MAVNQFRSMNADLAEGATDGRYRKARPDTTLAPAMGEEMVRQERSSLHPFHGYGFPNSQYPTPVTNTRQSFEA
jgi:hypothetical protein